MTENPQQEAQDLSRYAEGANEDMGSFYERWRERVHGWIAERSPREVADAVLLLPDMVALVLRLMKDPRVPLQFRGMLFAVALYAISPIDIVPEAMLGALGLADDTLVISTVVLRLMQQATEIDPKLIRENWSGQGDVVETMHSIVESKGELFNNNVWQRIRSLIGGSDSGSSAGPTVVEGQPKH